MHRLLHTASRGDCPNHALAYPASFQLAGDLRTRHCTLTAAAPLLLSQVDDLRGAVLAVSPDTRAGRIGFKVGRAADGASGWGDV